MNGFIYREKDFKTGAEFPQLWCGLKLSKVVSHLLSLSAREKNVSFHCCVPKMLRNLLLEPTNFEYWVARIISAFLLERRSEKGWKNLKRLFSRERLFSAVSFLPGE